MVTLIWGYTNHFQDRNLKLKGYSAFTLVTQKGLNLSEPRAVQGACVFTDLRVCLNPPKMAQPIELEKSPKIKRLSKKDVWFVRESK